MGKLIVIVGETGSGKSALGLEVARKFNGEIICADSRTVYRGMDIGTAKPTNEEMATIPHHLIDVVNPDESFNAAEFKRLAEVAIEAITAKGKTPIMVGGTGLYVDAVLYNYTFGPPVDLTLRSRYTAMSTDELQAEIARQGLKIPENKMNRRHLQRTLERGKNDVCKKSQVRESTLILGISLSKEVLRMRISERVDVMIRQGLIDEARTLFKQYGPQAEALQTPGYRALYEYIAGTISLDEAKAKFIQNDLRLAKRQRTWFKRNNSIHWLADPSGAVEIVTTFLSK